MDSIVKNRIMTMLPLLNEKQKRIYLATEAESLGYGGIKAVHKLTGVSQTTIMKGKKRTARMQYRTRSNPQEWRRPKANHAKV